MQPVSKLAKPSSNASSVFRHKDLAQTGDLSRQADLGIAVDNQAMNKR
jgi:hypothetical protein